MKAAPLMTLFGAITGPELLQVRYTFEGRTVDQWVRCGDHKRFVRLVDRPGVEVGLAPRRDKHPDAATTANCLWVRVESGEGMDRLRRFWPRPTLVLRETGVRATGVWALRDTLGFDWVCRANERLSFSLKGRRKYATPEALVPFRDVSYHDPKAMYRAREVVGGLRDAPNLKVWRQAA